MESPGGGSVTNAINSFWSRLWNKSKNWQIHYVAILNLSQKKIKKWINHKTHLKRSMFVKWIHVPKHALQYAMQKWEVGVKKIIKGIKKAEQEREKGKTSTIKPQETSNPDGTTRPLLQCKVCWFTPCMTFGGWCPLVAGNTGTNQSLEHLPKETSKRCTELVLYWLATGLHPCLPMPTRRYTPTHR